MKGRSRRILVAFLASVMLVSMPFTSQAVEPSGVEYSCTLNQAQNVFIGNEKPIDLKEGESMYLVYTVKSVDGTHKGYQQGVLGTDDTTQPFPYEKGGVLQYDFKTVLVDEGYTYFYKFMVVDGEMDCIIVKAKGDERMVVTLPNLYGDATDNYQYFGIWFGDGLLTTKLTHIMCYDDQGNDLGVDGAVDDSVMSYDNQVAHAYTVSGEKANNLALSNAKKTDANVVYMEYTVKKSDAHLYQTGVILTSAPKDTYPHNAGYLVYDMFKDNPNKGYLLEEGASYIIRFEKKANTLDAKVQKAKDGTFEVYTFPLTWGTYDSQANYFSLWFGEGGDYYTTLELINMKCYDDQGNNLGIQSNQAVVHCTHSGEIEDYSAAESVYYNDETGDAIGLYINKEAKVTRDGETETVTYRIQDSNLYLNYPEGKETYQYLYQKFSNEEASFRRLGTFYVTFVTGTDDAPEKQVVNMDTGYTALKPENPERKDAEFEGWVLSDGTDYNFDSLVTESLTLHAKWSDGIAYANADSLGSFGNPALLIAIAANAVLIVGGVAACILIRKKGKR